MTYTQETPNKTQNSPPGVRVVLKPAINSSASIYLKDWLSEFDLSPTWIQLLPKQGVSKAIPILPETENYPLLLQSICQQLGNQTTIQQEDKYYEISGVEVDTDDLYNLRLTLQPDLPLPKFINRAIHALFFQWLANADSELAETLHSSDNLPLTISNRVFKDNRVEIRITLLNRQLLSPLFLGLSRDLGKKIAIAKIPCFLKPQIDLADTSSYKDLLNVTPEKTINFCFHSPTSFKQNNCIQPFPLPELVFSNLLRRWNSFAPKEYHFPKVEWQGMTAAYDLKTKVIKKEVNEIGTVGWVKYEFKDAEQAKIATTLANFANFSGIGRKTALGMGRTQFKSKI
jgi:CRISPR-associated endoribonuclease Cas6